MYWAEVLSWIRWCGGSFWKNGWRRASSKRKQVVWVFQAFLFRMWRNLTKSHSCSRIILEHFTNDIKKLQVLRSIWLNITTEWLGVIAHVATSRSLFIPVEFTMMEVTSFRSSRNDSWKIQDVLEIIPNSISVSPRHFRWNRSQDALHHRQMLSIVVSLEECDSQVQFKHDASYRPDIAWLRPAKFENHLGRTVVTCAYDCTVMFMIESCTSEVDQSDVGALDSTYFTVLQREFQRWQSIQVTTVEGGYSPFVH